MDDFRLSDYDCIGFDLDSTILHYNITNLVHLEYKVITNFLVEKKCYDPEYFKEPLTDSDLDFLQKGLLYDLERGNVVKLTRGGKVHKATHGTKLLSPEEIEKYYPNREWALSKEFRDNPLMIWGHLALKIRTLLNCFDMTAGLVFAKLVDAMDKKYRKVLGQYTIWPDILDSFTFMYKREQLRSNQGNFYSELKANPGKYIYKCKPEVLDWIRNIRKTRKTYLITKSNSDFVALTTGYAFGEDWKSIFDIIVCYGQKPDFFSGNGPFYTLKDNFEDAVITGSELQVGEIYNQGNWKELCEFFARITNVENPRCIYVGDNLLQDIYAPSKLPNCDTVVVSDELVAEKIHNHDLSHSDESIINSNIWGSFFIVKTENGYEDTFWNDLIKKHSKICVPSMEVFCDKPLDEPIKCFKPEDDGKESRGYYPDKPVTLVNL